MDKKLYLSDLIKKHDIQFKKGQINLIQSPCGSGKTHFIMNELVSQNNVTYVCDTTALKDEIIVKYAQSIANELNVQLSDVLTEFKNGHYAIKNYVNGREITNQFMTYSAFGHQMKNKDVRFITCNLTNSIYIFDECHNLFEYLDTYNQDYPDSYDENGEYYVATDVLLDESFINNNLVIAVSATPGQLLTQNHVVDVLGEHKNELNSYVVHEKFNYSGSVIDLINNITYKKAVIYTSGSIDEIIKLRDELNLQGVKCEFLYSKNNNRKFTDFQAQVYRELIINGNISLVDVLIINSAYENGINIYDLDVDTFIYDVKMQHQKEYSKIQSLGRIRHDIKQCYTRIYAHDVKKEDKDKLKQSKLMSNRIELLEVVLDKKLTTSDFKSLCETLEFRNDKREIMKSTSAIKEIEKLGYKVTNKKSNGKTYKVIIKG